MDSSNPSTTEEARVVVAGTLSYSVTEASEEIVRLTQELNAARHQVVRVQGLLNDALGIAGRLQEDRLNDAADRQEDLAELVAAGDALHCIDDEIEAGHGRLSVAWSARWERHSRALDAARRHLPPQLRATGTEG